jgi:RNA polymerase sigma factor (TIGR02999 family)
MSGAARIIRSDEWARLAAAPGKSSAVPPESASSDAGSITQLIAAADRGDANARSQLFDRLYADLHRLAHSQLRRLAHPGLTLSPTTVLHEFYLDMSGREGTQIPDRARFLGYAACAMRGLIIDCVRERRAQKRGGLFHLTQLSTQIGDDAAEDQSLARLGEALEELGRADAPLAELVDLKYFCGLSFAEIAALRGVSERTIQRDWRKARLLLRGLVTEG